MFLHEAPDFPDLLAVAGGELDIDPALVEKDYWIMHCLHGLQRAGYAFELKGGTSLSKGYRLIHHFSEDIDIKIMPPDTLAVGRNHRKQAHIEARRAYFDALADDIRIPGITVQRDLAFDDERMRNAGIRMNYDSVNAVPEGVKQGVLLEAGFDETAPNRPCDISSWAFERARQSDLSDIEDNRAFGVPCYEPGYTFVEKLQTISTKFRKQQETGSLQQNFMRHYYDVYCLLDCADVRSFIGTDDYIAHKETRFRQADEQRISRNEAFLLSDDQTREIYEKAYQATSALYYRDMPDFLAILDRIAEHADRL
ncbi:nucleotidyl transferase AbiEii/AbiGii toxin family protein [Parvularcula flava]|uniref:Nucleotidyl transferase AbiEii/AbiGii toxin family protein n=1 Tax=Aquisalinus luteolus TaxID=1566827 RepID=A0A8J3EQD4_9PROT|nr:nucleotidyl transferase AbiEii/AbiGii toxin family protein [Aquisalinus luteolus]NHK27106.1 nucleotidyl transferase AbiEii/AbiGii toxin family protein [Aquisalinus luteolus]GGH94392.1 hypothetical protein GCM10011355_08470 [Aquisalinus luteolus]